MTDLPTPPAAPVRPGPTRLQRTTAIVATIGVVVALGGLALSLRPVSTPVQDCGTALAFVVRGRTNVYADPSDLPAGISAAEARDNNDRPCRERVADVAVPAGALLAAGVSVAVAATLVELSNRALAWRRRSPQRQPSAI